MILRNKNLEEEFIMKMRKRMREGEIKYGNNLDKFDFFKEMEDELIDIANYACLQFQKIKIHNHKSLRNLMLKRKN